MTSFGDGCGGEGVYGVFSRVTNYLGWIEKQIGHEIKYCKSGKLAGGVDLLVPESLTREDYQKHDAPTTRNPGGAKHFAGVLTRRPYKVGKKGLQLSRPYPDLYSTKCGHNPFLFNC